MTNCPSCGSPCEAGARFCNVCGKQLAAPATVSSGVPRCERHPEVEASRTCARCGTFVCPACLVRRVDGPEWCVACNEREPHVPLPWDRRAELGTLPAYWKTCLELLAAPGKRFATAPPAGSLGDAMLFAVISTVVGMGPSTLIYMVIGVVSGMAQGAGERGSAVIASGALLGAGVFGMVGQFVFTILISGVDHLFLKIAGARPGPWAVTFRATSLAMAPFLCGLVPLCGYYVFPIWWVVLKVFAYRSFHRTTGGKAAFGAIGPIGAVLLLCCGLYAVFFAMIGAASAFGHGP